MIEEVAKVRNAREIAHIAGLAANRVMKYGGAAVFYRVGTGTCATMSGTDPVWNAAMRKHAAHLVGVYAASVSRRQLTKMIADDMHEMRSVGDAA